MCDYYSKGPTLNPEVWRVEFFTVSVTEDPEYEGTETHWGTGMFSLTFINEPLKSLHWQTNLLTVWLLQLSVN